MSRQQKITVFTSPNCHDCQALKDFLAGEGAAFKVRDVSVDEEARREIMEKYGRLATPVLVAGDRIFLGFRRNREEIRKLVDAIVGSKDD